MTKPTFMKMPPWKRVLYHWRYGLGRMGLTIHALAEITQRTDAKSLLKEIAADTTKVYPQFCSEICSVVWTYGPGNGPNAHGLPAEKREGWYHLAFWTLNRFPYPEFKGTQSCLGIKTMAGVTVAQVAQLRQAMKGELIANGPEQW